MRVTKWSKLLDHDKKGQWWLSGDVVSSTDEVEMVASKIDGEVTEAQKMLRLAAAQRMNTDARRAIFCVIMSGEDFRDAFAKLLSLDLHGKQVSTPSYLLLSAIFSSDLDFSSSVIILRIERSCVFL